MPFLEVAWVASHGRQPGWAPPKEWPAVDVCRRYNSLADEAASSVLRACGDWRRRLAQKLTEGDDWSYKVLGRQLRSTMPFHEELRRVQQVRGLGRRSDYPVETMGGLNYFRRAATPCQCTVPYPLRPPPTPGCGCSQDAPGDHAVACAQGCSHGGHAWVHVARKATGPEGQVVPQQRLTHTPRPRAWRQMTDIDLTWSSTASRLGERRAATPCWCPPCRGRLCRRLGWPGWQPPAQQQPNPPECTGLALAGDLDFCQ